MLKEMEMTMRKKRNKIKKRRILMLMKMEMKMRKKRNKIIKRRILMLMNGMEYDK